MSFVYPSFLWGFALLLIPILVHLFNFRRYKTIYFSSIQFIKKVEQQTNATKNLRHYLILASRLLAFSCLVLAFAQPYFPTGEDEKSADQVIAIYLDNSYSMSAKGTNGDLLNHAKETLREMITKQSRDQKYMLVTNELSGIEHRIISSTELSDRLERIHLSSVSRALNEPIQSIRDFLSNEGYDGDVQYLVLSDLQRSKDLKRSFQTGLVDTTANYTFLKFTPQNAKNLYIDSVWFEQPFQRKGENSTLNIRVNNHSDAAITNAEVQLNVGKTNRQALIDLPANDNAVLTMNYTNKSDGYQSGKVTIMDEQLHFDNTFYFSYEVKQELNVIIVDGANATNYAKRVFETDDFYAISTYNIDQLKPNSLIEGDLIVLNGIEELSSGLRTKLDQLTQEGKGVFIIPAVDPDLNSYNQLLKMEGLPLLGKINKQPLRIKRIATNYPFYRGMFDKAVDNIRMPPIAQHFGSRVYNSSNYNDLITMENGDPLFVQGGGQKKIYMLYSAADEKFNDFSKSALFASIMLRAGELSQQNQRLSLTLGSSESYSPNISSTQDETIELSNGDYRFIPSTSIQNDQISIHVRLNNENNSIAADNYDVLYKQNKVGEIALNYDRQESRLNYYSAEELTGILKAGDITNTSFTSLEDFGDIRELSVSKPNEYWRILLTLALVFFIAEMLIVLFWKV